MKIDKEQVEQMAQIMCGFCTEDKRCILKYSAPCSEVANQDCTCKESTEMLLDRGYSDVPRYKEQIELLKSEVEPSKNAAYSAECKLRTATHIFEDWLKEKNVLIAELRDIIQQYENVYPCKLYQERLKIVLTTIRRCEQTTFDDAKKYKITDKEELKID